MTDRRLALWCAGCVLLALLALWRWPAGPWLQQLNALLKRLCRERYPDSGSHVLSSRAWLAFLDNRCPAAGLTRRAYPTTGLEPVTFGT